MNMTRKNDLPLIALSLLIGVLAAITTSVESIGVCNGMLGNNLPSQRDVVTLYKNKGIGAMRLYTSKDQSETLNALKNTGIEVLLDVPNESLGPLADASAAKKWVQENILAYPGVSFKYIAVGNEMPDDYSYAILPAMSKIWDALCSANQCGQIKVSTAVRFDVLNSTSPPSSARFAKSYMGPIAQFLANTGGPLLVNVYPFFSYSDSNGGIRLDYALFEATDTVFTDNNYKYNNLFDAMVDSVHYALEKAGTPNVAVVVSESGWPTNYDHTNNKFAAATKENAQTYNQNLINHVVSGTPKKPGINLETYIFAMFNENSKTGDETERNFGLFYPNQSAVYPISFK